MKAFKLLFILFSLVVIAGCENYPKSEIDHTPIYPLSGEWRVRIKDLNGDSLITKTMYTFGTYNTADNDLDKMWIRTTSSMAGGLGALRGKISCNVADLSFSGADISDISATTGATFTITEGKVTLNALDMPSKVKADKISFKYTTSKLPGRTFLFEGFRRTLWPKDDTYINF